MQYPWEAKLQERGLLWPAEASANFARMRVQAYYDFLQENANFFSKQDRQRILERHLYESLIFCLHLQKYIATRRAANFVSRETTLLDAGSGPGLPGFLYACLQGASDVTLLDASRRKLGCLARWHAARMSYPQDSSFSASPALHFVFERLEEHQKPSGGYDCIVTRAVLPFPFAIELGCHLQELGGIWALAVAHLSETLISHNCEYLAKLGYGVKDILKMQELEFLGLRQILILEKLHNTTAGYPRSWKVIRRLSRV